MQFDMVFEGGGAKGVVFVGALETFAEQGHTYGRLMGTSAGAITAALLAAGYSATEMGVMLEETIDGVPVFATFMDPPADFDEATIAQSLMREWLRDDDNPLMPNWAEERLEDWIADNMLRSQTFRHIFSLVEQGGWFAADSFVNWLRMKLNAAPGDGGPGGYGDMTLAEFYAATQRHLSVVAADTTAGRLLVLNHNTAPDLPLVWAVRMSMSIPLLWQEVVWQEAWGRYMGHDVTGDAVVDGGLLSGFPIELFIANSWSDWMDRREGGRILGLLIDERSEVPGQPATSDGGIMDGAVGRFRTGRRLINLINTMTQARDKAVTEENKDLVVALPAKGYGTTEFDMTPERRGALVAAGAAAMVAYLDGLGPEPAQIAQFDPAEAARTSAADDVAGKILGGAW
jgi:NTE family protein